ncbi:hypothetical protein [Ureibacillus manganicus]|uniref:Uncharacterized protein n=1 Tax=Ureibacillus manganicus DSM 26584 TaxID=1384049 RepID=A0A0A3I9G2_9BACL|nr:hypothetical protein [Ureibacillus manganicus]KGR79423.1 hypothetical protein CD29_06945 [Ureibacillus manganicus DSM 26584]
MKYFSIFFIIGVFLFMFIIFPIMDALEVPSLGELLGMLFTNHYLWTLLLITLFILMMGYIVYRGVKKIIHS